jgi:hypothetical protein
MQGTQGKATSMANGLGEIGSYLRQLEKANRQLAIENAQLRVSHSYRLGNAFVSFAKHRRLSAVPMLLRQISDAMRPMPTHAPPVHKRPAEFHGMLGAVSPDLLRKRIDEAPAGTSIARQVEALTSGEQELRIVGILGEDLRRAWGSSVFDGALAFDRYDSEWVTHQPTHLVVDADHLAISFGWAGVFTLRDPAATVEMVAMLEKARRRGIRTVLVEPADAYRAPLLSRMRTLFDVALQRDDATLDRMAAAGLVNG